MTGDGFSRARADFVEGEAGPGEVQYWGCDQPGCLNVVPGPEMPRLASCGSHGATPGRFTRPVVRVRRA